MNTYVHKSEYFWGNKISNYGLDNGYIDYRTLSKSMDLILNNSIMANTYFEDWEVVNGSDYYYIDTESGNLVEYDDIENWDNICECYNEYYQYYIISENGYNILSECTNETVWYNEKLDIYLWGITHWGTSWDYVLTDIKIELGGEV